LLPGDRTRADTSLQLPIRESGWYILRARGNQAVYPVLDAYPYATTSPVYVIVGGRPIRSASDAQYFVSWIDRLEGAAVKSRDWNNEQERTTTLEAIRRAREEFIRRRDG
jgi:hypothetical protein